MVTQHNYFETKVNYTGIDEVTGKQVKLSDSYLIDALSFSEAEARTIKEVEPFMSGEFSVEAVKRSNVYEVFPETEPTESDLWFKLKIDFIVLDKEKRTEKHISSNIIVEADSIEMAITNLKLGMRGTMSDYEVVSVTKTGIVGVIGWVEERKEKEDEN